MSLRALASLIRHAEEGDHGIHAEIIGGPGGESLVYVLFCNIFYLLPQNKKKSLVFTIRLLPMFETSITD